MTASPVALGHIEPGAAGFVFLSTDGDVVHQLHDFDEVRLRFERWIDGVVMRLHVYQARGVLRRSVSGDWCWVAFDEQPGTGVTQTVLPLSELTQTDAQCWVLR